MNSDQRRLFRRAINRIENRDCAPPTRDRRSHTGAIEHLAHRHLRRKLRREHDTRVRTVGEPIVGGAFKLCLMTRVINWLLSHSHRAGATATA